MCSIDIVFFVCTNGIGCFFLLLLLFFALIWHSTVCSFNEKANSKKLFTPIGFSVYFLNIYFFLKCRKRKTRKSFFNFNACGRDEKSIMRFDSVWWFIDGNCTIGLGQYLAIHLHGEFFNGSAWIARCCWVCKNQLLNSTQYKSSN